MLLMHDDQRSKGASWEDVVVGARWRAAIGMTRAICYQLWRPDPSLNPNLHLLRRHLQRSASTNFSYHQPLFYAN